MVGMDGHVGWRHHRKVTGMGTRCTLISSNLHRECLSHNRSIMVVFQSLMSLVKYLPCGVAGIITEGRQRVPDFIDHGGRSCRRPDVVAKS